MYLLLHFIFSFVKLEVKYCFNNIMTKVVDIKISTHDALNYLHHVRSRLKYLKDK